jgi:hypothetical protein
LPLTGKPKTGKFYYNLKVGERDASIIVTQLRVLDAKRLVRKLHIIDKEDFAKVLKLTLK